MWSITQRRLVLAAALTLSLSSLFAQGGTQDAAQAKPWYAGRLEKLGFTVFPKPEALDNFTIKAMGGTTSSLNDQKGKIVLLNFWATWCPPCRAEMPAIEKLWKRTKDRAFTVMGVSVGEAPDTVRGFIAKQGYSYPIYVDPSGALGTAFGARSIPTTYILDKTGSAIAGMVGGAPYDSDEAAAIFAELASR
jgi:peroxiredoxin